MLVEDVNTAQLPFVTQPIHRGGNDIIRNRRRVQSLVVSSQNEFLNSRPLAAAECREQLASYRGWLKQECLELQLPQIESRKIAFLDQPQYV
jgi:hypothetical protein